MPTAHDPVNDPRADALAVYFRERAAAFSLSADVTDTPHTAAAGLALLDAAAEASGLTGEDRRLRALSESGAFESMPDGGARFHESRAVHHTVQRLVLSDAVDGAEIVDRVVAAACENAEQPTGAVHRRQRVAPPGAARLSRLLQEVKSARALLEDQRRLPGTVVRPASAHAKLVEALDAYIDALESQGHPIPYAMRDELRLLRRIWP
ncbi:MAG TPA: hypothetical protein VLA97_03610 [Nocardioidaceae bacterium]|nr:hypothetical protein [Nocardioidaceae bacterium]